MKREYKTAETLDGSVHVLIKCGYHLGLFKFPKNAGHTFLFETSYPQIFRYGSTFFAWLTQLESLTVEQLISGLEANGFQNANVSSVS